MDGRQFGRHRPSADEILIQKEDLGIVIELDRGMVQGVLFNPVSASLGRHLGIAHPHLFNFS